MSTGTISGLALKTGDDFTIGGEKFWTQYGNTSWGLSQIDSQTLRFEVRSGDQWHRDPDWKERSEIGGDKVYAAGETINVSYSFMVEPGQTNTADWFVMGQFHADDSFTSPPFAIELVGDKMAVVVRHPIEGTSKYKTIYVYVDDQNIQRGKYYDIKISVNFENNSKGFLNVWRDGKQIVDYDGPIGYGYGVYWKNGIYREESNETIAINYKNFSITTGDETLIADGGNVIVGTPSGDTIDADTTPSGQPSVTDKGDTIVVGGGSDAVVAGKGSDKIIGGKGKDILKGGVGNDLIKGNGGNDKLFGVAGNNNIFAGKGNDKVFSGTGNDVLVGGRGKDTFVFTGNFGNDTVKRFNANQDLIQFDKALFTGYAALKPAMSSYKNGVLIDAGDNKSVFIDNVKLAKLDAGDFLFA